MITGQRLAGGADRIELVVLGAVASGRTCGTVDFDGPFAGFEQEGRQAGAEAAAAFDLPHASSGPVPGAEVEAASVSHGVGGALHAGEGGAGGCVDDGGGVASTG